MTQSFKRLYARCTADPRLVLQLFALPFFLAGCYWNLDVLMLPALLVIVLAALWGRACSTDFGYNFTALPRFPGEYRTICQRRQKGAKHRPCRELRKTVLQDDRTALDALPDGSYQALTHEAVLRRLERRGDIVLLAVYPADRDTLHSVLSGQTGGQCRRCPNKCAAWNAPERQFYRVLFRKSSTEIQERSQYENQST